MCTALSFRLQRIHAFRLTSAEVDRLACFYVQALGFNAGPGHPIPPDELALLGLAGSGYRIPLRLGNERLDLDAFDPPGRPYPGDAIAADLVFQHLALATSDAAAAWERAQQCGATSLSVRGPVTLPQSAGGVTAVKFRDPEGHPLELLQFPAGANELWCPGHGVLGIDHSALCVGDVQRARDFFLDHGLELGACTINAGAEQSMLDGLEPVRVEVVSLRPGTAPPHLELLAYRTPRGRRAAPCAPNDIAATRTVWQSDIDALVRDPAGHLHLLRQCPG